MLQDICLTRGFNWFVLEDIGSGLERGLERASCVQEGIDARIDLACAGEGGERRPLLPGLDRLCFFSCYIPGVNIGAVDCFLTLFRIFGPLDRQLINSPCIVT